MEKINSNPRLLKYLISKNVFQKNPFVVVDIGASGGIDSIWNLFKNQIRFICFEPDEVECNKLNQLKNADRLFYPYALSNKVQSKDFFLGDFVGGSFYKNSNLFKKLTASSQESWNESQDKGSGSIQKNQKSIKIQTISFDEFIKANSIEAIDFIKIDTDGEDFEILSGMKNFLQTDELIGITTEMFFNEIAEGSNNFYFNHGNFLKERGYDIYDLDIYKYSRKHLPSKFLYSIPAQTTKGQIMWGQGLFFKSIENLKNNNLKVSKLLKQACLFEIHNLEDCAAELLITYKEIIEKELDSRILLNLLVPEEYTSKYNFEEYIDFYKKNTKEFFPKY